MGTKGEDVRKRLLVEPRLEPIFALGTLRFGLQSFSLKYKWTWKPKSPVQRDAVPAILEADAVATPEGFAHPEFLVRTDWLAAHLGQSDLRIVDCTVRIVFDPHLELTWAVASGQEDFRARPHSWRAVR